MGVEREKSLLLDCIFWHILHSSHLLIIDKCTKHVFIDMVQSWSNLINDNRDSDRFIWADFWNSGRLVAVLFQEEPCKSWSFYEARTLEILSSPELLWRDLVHNRLVHNSSVRVQWLDNFLRSLDNHFAPSVRLWRAHPRGRVSEAWRLDWIWARNELLHSLVSERPRCKSGDQRLWKIQPHHCRWLNELYRHDL